MCEASFIGANEGSDEGLPGGVRVGGLGGVDFCLGVTICFGPEGADVVTLGTIVLCGVD